MLNTMMVPFFLAFPELETSQLEITGHVITGSFGVDLFINFVTAYYDSNLHLIDNYKVMFHLGDLIIFIGHCDTLYDGLVFYRPGHDRAI